MCRAVDSLVSSYSWRKALCCSWNQNPAWSKVAAKPFKGKRGRSLSDFTRWLRLIRQVLHRQVSPSCAALIFPLFNLIIRFVCFTSVCWFLFYYFLGGGALLQSLIKSAAHLQVLKLLLCLCDYLLLKPELGLSFLNGLAASLPKKCKGAAEDIFCFLGGGGLLLCKM